MSYGPAHSVEAHDIDAGRHLAMWFFGMVGILTATTGIWVSVVPETVVFSLIFVTLDMSGMSRFLGPTLLLVGGAVLALAMLSAAGRDYHFQAAWWMVLLQAVLGLVGVAAAILGALALLDRADIYTFPSLPF